MAGGLCVSFPALQCCECALPVRDGGPLRAVLLVPCQHFLHAGCAEFFRRTQWRRRCPACRAAVRRAVPLFPNSSGTKEKREKKEREEKREEEEEEEREATVYRAVHKRQRAAAAQCRALCDVRARVAKVSAECAELHSRRAEAQTEADKLARLMPSSSSPSYSSSYSSSSFSSRVKEMTGTELELFVAQAAQALVRLERDVRHAKREEARRKARVAAAREKYRRARALWGNRKEKEREKEKEEEVEGKGDRDEEEDEEEVESKGDRDEEEEEERASNSSSSSSVGAVRNEWAQNTELRNRTVVDVDVTETFEIASDSGSDAGDVVIIAQRPPQPAAECISPRRHSDGDEEDIALHFPQLTPISKCPVNASRLLPRRDDRLWQSSLEDVFSHERK